MYLMNFLFDFDDKSGIFSGDQTPPPGTPPELYTSKNWLKLLPSAAVPEPGNPFPPGFNPEPANWSNLDDMDSGTLLVPQSPPPDDANIGIRIALDPSSAGVNPISLGTAANDATLTLSVCFGRPSQAAQKRASPFIDAADPKLVLTTFVFVNQKANQMSGPNFVSWFFPLGLVKFRPTKKYRTHRYQFSVGVVVSSRGVIRHFSHDPDMDITT